MLLKIKPCQVRSCAFYLHLGLNLAMEKSDNGQVSVNIGNRIEFSSIIEFRLATVASTQVLCKMDE